MIASLNSFLLSLPLPAVVLLLACPVAMFFGWILAMAAKLGEVRGRVERCDREHA